MFLSVIESDKLFVYVYVDDLIITGSSQDKIDEVISKLSEVFPIRNLEN